MPCHPGRFHTRGSSASRVFRVEEASRRGSGARVPGLAGSPASACVPERGRRCAIPGRHPCSSSAPCRRAPQPRSPPVIAVHDDDDAASHAGEVASAKTSSECLPISENIRAGAWKATRAWPHEHHHQPEFCQHIDEADDRKVCSSRSGRSIADRPAARSRSRECRARAR